MELPKIIDGAPIYGMNSRDDPKDLSDGEVVSLVNAYPGNPPIPRKGCRHYVISGTDGYECASHAIPFIADTGTKFILLWVKDGTDYHLIKINLTTKVRTILGTATGLIDPAFRLIHIHDYIYSICDEDMYWEGSLRATRHKIIEIGDEGANESDVIREMCVNVYAGVDSIVVQDGSTFGIGYMSYAFAFVRHDPSDTTLGAFDSNGVAQVLTTFTPGYGENTESILNRIVAGRDSAEFGIRINLLHGEDYVNAIEQGATHLRVYRTRQQTSESEAQGATHYFSMDIPIPVSYAERNIENIELVSENAKVSVDSHGFSNGKALFALIGDTDLDGVEKDITVVNDDVFEIDNSNDVSYDFDETPPSYVSQDYVSIVSFDLSNTNVRITTSSAHGWNTNDTVLLTGITGADGYDGNGERVYKYWLDVVTRYIIQMRTLGSYLGLNDGVYTITKIDDTTIELQNTLSEDYKIPYQNNPDKPEIYPEESKIPTMTGGYAASTLKDVISLYLTENTNNVVIETVEKHGLEDNNYVLPSNIVGSTELNDNSYKVEVLSDYRLKLVEQTTTGISAYLSGGTLIPSAGPLIVDDEKSDAALAGETAQLFTTTYSAAPKAGFCEYAKTRLWLFGLQSSEKGRAYYSEVPGGSGATPDEAAQTYPEKFLNLFHYNYYIDLSIKKGYLPTGIIRLAGDLYFFFEGEIYVLFGSDPTLAEPQLISDEIGCAFPDTLIIGEVPIFDGQCLLYISNLGPAITKQGGETILFTDYKIDELWPEENKELYGDLDDQREHIIHNCYAEYWDNTWWVTYENSNDEKKTFGYYFNPDLKDNPRVPHGPFQFSLAEV